MVVSVPIKNKCLSLSDTILITDAVGALDTTVALTVRGAATDGFQVNVLPFLIVATRICPKLSSDQDPGASTVFVVFDCTPQPVHKVAFVTIALSKCDAAVVPLVPLTQPVKVVPVKAV